MLRHHGLNPSRWPSSVTVASPVTTAAGARLERAIVETVAYADVFDYPLTLTEVHRYLTGVQAAREAVEAALAETGFAGRHVTCVGDHVVLNGRHDLIERRAHRRRVARRLWPRAERYGAIIARLPFVRLVTVSGALAVDNVEPEADIDYFVVTVPERLWLCRAMTIVIVRAANRFGDRLCPNYFLSERALALADRNLFTARELTQLVPLAGFPTYRLLRRLNAWTTTYLPNALDPPRALPAVETPIGRSRRAAEALGHLRMGAWIDTWEMNRKARRFGQRVGLRSEASFGPDSCKGHFEGHGRRALEAFDARLRALGLAT